MTIVQAAPPADYRWLKRRTHCALTDDFRAIEAIDERGRIRGMVGFCLWAPNSVQCHMATETPIIWRHLLRPALSYAFEEVGVWKMIGVIPSRNRHSISLCEHVGFRETHRIDDGWERGEDLCVLEFTRQEAVRWLCMNRRAA
jgi:L-amino acid N-acyltransferase YncA